MLLVRNVCSKGSKASCFLPASCFIASVTLNSPAQLRLDLTSRRARSCTSQISAESAVQMPVIRPSLRDIRVRAVPEGDVADQDPVCRRHRRHEGRLQGKSCCFGEVFPDLIVSTGVDSDWLVAAGARSPGHRSHDGEAWYHNRGDRPRGSSGTYPSTLTHHFLHLVSHASVFGRKARGLCFPSRPKLLACRANLKRQAQLQSLMVLV